MKNTIIAATALVAGAALVAYYVKKRKAVKEIKEPAMRPGHHLTNVFSRAKEHSLDM